MKIRSRHFSALVACAAIAITATGSTPASAGSQRAASGEADRSYYILPPGNYGGLPTSENSLDQLPLYDGLTPLRGNVTDADIASHYLPENFAPVGATREEPTGRPGTHIVYDSYGVPHITGDTRADMAFGAGWVTARDRQLLLLAGRGPSRAAVADIPGINAFSLVTSGQSFVPSAATEQLVTDQQQLIIDTYGDKGREIIADAQAEADGINAYRDFIGMTGEPPATVNDVIAVTAFIGSIFGAGGGAETSNSELLAKLQQGLGTVRGRQAWEDAMLFNDPEAPTTIRRRFDYPTLTGGPVTGSLTIDPGSVVSLDPTKPLFGAAASRSSNAGAPLPTPSADAPTYPAAGPVPYRKASNFQVVNPRRSATGNTLAVMGPQLGYYYPEIVEQVHLRAPGIDAQGVGVPAAMMYILIGRTHDYAWSLTSANHDVRDVFAEELCNPDGTPPTRNSRSYLFDGRCVPFEIFDAGTLNGTPVVYPKSVHGPVIGTATIGGKPYALTRQRSTFGRDGLNLGALKDLTENKATTPSRFFKAANQFGFTFNWAYASRTSTAYFSSGLLPKRAPGLDRRLPTLGTGDYEWRGYLSMGEHPHQVSGRNGLLLNWNNQSAPGFMHGDEDFYGSVDHVELFDKWPAQAKLTDAVGIMNRAATEDQRSIVWPVVSRLLRGDHAPNALSRKTIDVLDDWVKRDAPRLDADLDGKNDDAGPVIMDALWRPIADAVMQPVYGDLLDDLDSVRRLSGDAGQSYVDKDLRTLLGDPVQGRFNLSYCGNGSLTACRASLWAVVDQISSQLATAQGTDPSTWRGPASRTGFTPGLIPDTMRSTNRPTFQQVLELRDHP